MKVNPKNRAVSYIRMSSNRQTDSPDRQRSQVEPWKAHQKYKNVSEYKDEALCGDDENRPDFLRLLADARRGRFDVIVIDEASRLSRETLIDYIVEVAKPLRDSGVVVDIVGQGVLDWDDLGDQIRMVINQDRASGETRMLSGRIIKDFRMRAQRGDLFTGPEPPFGLQFLLNDKGERIPPGYVIVPEQAEVVRFIFDCYVDDGMSVSEISQILYERGIPAPRGGARWGTSTVYALLTNPVYRGAYAWGKTSRGKHHRLSSASPTGFAAVEKGRKPERHVTSDWFLKENNHAQIVCLEKWEAAQAMRIANQRNTSPNRKYGKHPLSGLLECPGCGSRMHAQPRDGKPGYGCPLGKKRGCKSYFVHETEVVHRVVAVLQEFFKQTENVTMLRSALEQQSDNGEDRRKEQAEHLRRRLTQLETEVTKARKKLILLDEGNIPFAQAQIDEWLGEQQEAKEQLALLEKPTPVSNLDVLISNVSRLSEIVLSADPKLVHLLLKETIERVELAFETRTGKYDKHTWKEGCIHLRESEVSSTTGPGRV